VSATLQPTAPSARFRTRRRVDAGTESDADRGRAGGARRGPGALAILWTVVGLLLIAGLGALVVGPGRGMRSDIASQRALVADQLETTRAQLEVTRTQLQVTQRQLDLTTEQLDITKDQRRIALEQLDLAQEQLATARAQLGKTEESLAIQRRLAAVAEETLQQAREINRKTPDAQPTDGL
jgi:chromosome segregation ATPase